MKEKYEEVKDALVLLQLKLNSLLNDRHSSGTCLSETVNNLENLRITLRESSKALEYESQHRLHAGMCYMVF